ncbi:MAG: DUF192 domain-containing protein [Snowella sp.]
MKTPISLLIILGFALLSCSTSPPIKSESKASPIVSEKPPLNQGQQLPITAKTTIKGQAIALEVARTPEQQMLGLMYRTSLPDNQGMLFTFNPPRSARFWMKNVSLELDMIFLKQGTVTAIFSNVPPCNIELCPTYGPAGLMDQVIELRGGRSQELGLKVGDRLAVDFINN